MSGYIELNPVRAVIVDDPAGYRWSSYRANGLGQHPAQEQQFGGRDGRGGNPPHPDPLPFAGEGQPTRLPSPEYPTYAI